MQHILTLTTFFIVKEWDENLWEREYEYTIIVKQEWNHDDISNSE